MTHDEYLSRLEEFSDSSDDVEEVLSHTVSCALCRRESRFVERELSRLDPGRRSIAEEVARFGATAAVVVAIVLGIHRLSVRPHVPTVAEEPRYRIVGDASGVVAYTPAGVVVGLAKPSDSGTKGIMR